MTAAKQKFPEQGFRIPRGRFVRGDFTKKTTTNHQNQPLPENKHHYWIVIAVEKSAPGIGEALMGIVTHAWQSYQSVAGAASPQSLIGMTWQRGQAGGAGMFDTPGFAWKIDDGDTDPKWSTREGCRGCWVIQMSTTFDLACFDAANAQLDPKVFKLGDFIDAYITCSINGEVGNTAGIYLNPRGIRYLGEGPRITVGPDANTMFGAPVGPGYAPQPPAAGAMSQQVMGSLPGGPGMAGPAPGMMAPQPQPAPAPAPAPAPQPQQEPAEIVARRHGQPHHPGWRFNPSTWGYEADTPQQPAAHGAPAMQMHAPALPSAGGYAGGPGAGYAPGIPGNPGNAAGGLGVPAGAPGMPAPSVAPGGYLGSASPSNYGPGNMPPVQPHPGFIPGR